jgi:hypothetical protein
VVIHFDLMNPPIRLESMEVAAKRADNLMREIEEKNRLSREFHKKFPEKRTEAERRGLCSRRRALHGYCGCNSCGDKRPWQLRRELEVAG